MRVISSRAIDDIWRKHFLISCLFDCHLPAIRPETKTCVFTLLKPYAFYLISVARSMSSFFSFIPHSRCIAVNGGCSCATPADHSAQLSSRYRPLGLRASAFLTAMSREARKRFVFLPCGELTCILIERGEVIPIRKRTDGISIGKCVCKNSFIESQ
ncbi:hypothetical protein HGRIS_013621 [Hohenbuehelia grisea]|uniref:Uncharacterized protein n=1 Tax=Hohenbuehelia grisea TaxID=104357 RepID=A0ABR3IW72_9AGAR